MPRNFKRQLRALVASLFVVFAAVVYLSLPHAAARVSTAQATQTGGNPNASPAQATTASSSSAAAFALTPQEKRGKQIYLRGTSASGKEILAYLGEASLEVPASTMTCANCHGFEGQGKPEGGVAPSNITWEALTKSYGVTHASGRKHPPYTER
ncbi:MAG TPA: hypothetical protein VF634_13560, partial [Pyrinomonadaceae bacterium]